MRTKGSLIALAALLVVALHAHAQGGEDDAAARAIIAKAMMAQGGEANLAKIEATYLKGTGTIHVAGESLSFAADWYIQGMAQQKINVDVTSNGMTFQIVKVIDVDKGWQKIGGGDAKALSKDELADEKHELYAGYVQTLAPLKDKKFKLSSLGEVKVDDKDAVGVCVACKDHKDVNLYFDKKSHLLVKVETRVSDQGNEVNQEILLGNYKATDGTQQAHKIAILRDGKRFIEAEFSEIRMHTQKLDASIFSKP